METRYGIYETKDEAEANASGFEQYGVEIRETPAGWEVWMEEWR